MDEKNLLWEKNDFFSLLKVWRSDHLKKSNLIEYLHKKERMEKNKNRDSTLSCCNLCYLNLTWDQRGLEVFFQMSFVRWFKEQFTSSPFTEHSQKCRLALIISWKNFIQIQFCQIVCEYLPIYFFLNYTGKITFLIIMVYFIARIMYSMISCGKLILKVNRIWPSLK